MLKGCKLMKTNVMDDNGTCHLTGVRGINTLVPRHHCYAIATHWRWAPLHVICWSLIFEWVTPDSKVHGANLSAPGGPQEVCMKHTHTHAHTHTRTHTHAHTHTHTHTHTNRRVRFTLHKKYTHTHTQHQPQADVCVLHYIKTITYERYINMKTVHDIIKSTRKKNITTSWCKLQWT